MESLTELNIFNTNLRNIHTLGQAPNLTRITFQECYNIDTHTNSDTELISEKELRELRVNFITVPYLLENSSVNLIFDSDSDSDSEDVVKYIPKGPNDLTEIVNYCIKTFPKTKKITYLGCDQNTPNNL